MPRWATRDGEPVLVNDLDEAWSEAARKAALEARRAKARLHLDAHGQHRLMVQGEGRGQSVHLKPEHVEQLRGHVAAYRAGSHSKPYERVQNGREEHVQVGVTPDGSKYLRAGKTKVSLDDVDLDTVHNDAPRAPAPASGTVHRVLRQVERGTELTPRRRQDLLGRGLARWDGPGKKKIVLTDKGRAMLQESALAEGFEERLHPRGRGGRFALKLGHAGKFVRRDGSELKPGDRVRATGHMSTDAGRIIGGREGSLLSVKKNHQGVLELHDTRSGATHAFTAPMVEHGTGEHHLVAIDSPEVKDRHGHELRVGQFAKVGNVKGQITDVGESALGHPHVTVSKGDGTRAGAPAHQAERISVSKEGGLMRLGDPLGPRGRNAAPESPASQGRSETRGPRGGLPQFNVQSELAAGHVLRSEDGKDTFHVHGTSGHDVDVTHHRASGESSRETMSRTVLSRRGLLVDRGSPTRVVGRSNAPDGSRRWDVQLSGQSVGQISRRAESVSGGTAYMFRGHVGDRSTGPVADMEVAKQLLLTMHHGRPSAPESPAAGGKRPYSGVRGDLVLLQKYDDKWIPVKGANSEAPLRAHARGYRNGLSIGNGLKIASNRPGDPPEGDGAQSPPTPSTAGALERAKVLRAGQSVDLGGGLSIHKNNSGGWGVHRNGQDVGGATSFTRVTAIVDRQRHLMGGRIDTAQDAWHHAMAHPDGGRNLYWWHKDLLNKIDERKREGGASESDLRYMTGTPGNPSGGDVGHWLQQLAATGVIHQHNGKWMIGRVQPNSPLAKTLEATHGRRVAARREWDPFAGDEGE